MSTLGTVDTTWGRIERMDDIEWLGPETYASENGVSVKTVRRHLTAGRIPGAVKRPNGTWVIPAHAKIAPAGPADDAPASTVSTVATMDSAPLSTVPLVLTVEESARALRTSPYAIRRMLRTGQLEGHKFGPHGSWTVPTGAILDMGRMRQ